jgi:hypothetical protein
MESEYTLQIFLLSKFVPYHSNMQKWNKKILNTNPQVELIENGIEFIYVPQILSRTSHKLYTLEQTILA